MFVINHLGLRHGWIIPTDQNSKLLLMSRYTTVIHIVFLQCTDTFTQLLFWTLFLTRWKAGYFGISQSETICWEIRMVWWCVTLAR